MPFFGGYEQEDVLGLIEISANLSNRKNFGVTPKVVDYWENILCSYHNSNSKSEFISQLPYDVAQFLPHRYGEWLEVTELTKNLDLTSKSVLDLGAGLGFDSHRLYRRGAAVTALEFSPLLAEAGNINFPHLRWIGGFSHLLPFQDNSFDFIFCNAALHHMRDIPAALSEALRVLKPGGRVITTCDSFCPSTMDDQYELAIFNSDPTVLLGVNERIPRFSEFAQTLEEMKPYLTTEIYTHTFFPPSTSLLKPLNTLHKWNFIESSRLLSASSGSLALSITLNSSPDIAPACQESYAISPHTYACLLTSEESCVIPLNPLIPSHYVDLPLISFPSTKFELLNGWLQPNSNQYRTAYKRGRWFLRSRPSSSCLFFKLRLNPKSRLKSAPFDIILNGESVSTLDVLHSRWTSIRLPLDHLELSSTFCIEIKCKDTSSDFDNLLFDVSSRQYLPSLSSLELESSLDQLIPCNIPPHVFVVIPVFNRPHFTLSCIRQLKLQSYVYLTIIVSDGGSSEENIQSVRDAHPDVIYLRSRTTLWWSGSMALGITHAFELGATESDFILMMNNDTDIPIDYVQTLLKTSLKHKAAVGALIVDSKNHHHILDAGEQIDWSNYTFPVKSHVIYPEKCNFNIDALPGRGSLVPISMISSAGNVDSQRFPHYLADYEFFTRIKKCGFQLCITYETSITAYIEETGIIPGSTTTGFNIVWAELFSRRSMNNIVDHMLFISLHAPANCRIQLLSNCFLRAFRQFIYRSPLRFPFYILLFPIKFVRDLPFYYLSFERLIRRLLGHL